MEYVTQFEQVNPLRKILRKLVLPGMKLSYYGIADWFLLSLFVLPTYFGMRLGFFDLTAFRVFEILLLICIFKDKNKRNQFIKLVQKCPYNIWIGAYMFVVIYTNLIHPSLNTIFYWLTNGVIVFFCVSYLIVYEYGVEGFFNKLRQFAWVVSVLSPMELIIRKSPFSLLDTLGKAGTNVRFGSVRIMGNCTTANGYALYLMILFPLMCYDWKIKKMDLGHNKWLLILMGINIFLTGSRLTVGTLVLGIVLCFVAQNKHQITKSLVLAGIFIPSFIILLFIFRDVAFINGLLRTLFSAIDEILGTSYAVKFGANAQALYNSSYYRELLWKNTILGDWLNPFLGRGGSYNFGMYIEGYRIFSVDNFYVGQYITYAWPGVITWLIMSGSFLITALKQFLKNKNMLCWSVIVSIMCYFIGLWYLDHLQTFPIMISVFALVYALGWEKSL